MSEFLPKLFIPHIVPGDPDVIVLHAVSDALIALSYFLIPTAFLFVVRRRDVPFRWAYILGCLFVLACGTVHILNVVTLWHPVYFLEGVVKAVTALASMATAVVLVRLAPTAAAMPGPAQFRREIEDRRRAECQVKELTEKLDSGVRERNSQLNSADRNLAEFSATLDKTQVVLQKLDGTILYWNSSAEAIYGWPAEEALGRKSHELLAAELPQPFEEIQAELLKDDSWSGEYKQHCRDGRIIWVASRWVLHRDAFGEPASVAQVSKDITERTNKASRISEGTVRSLFENASQGILVADRDNRVVDSNAAMQVLFGYSRAELIGAPLEMLLPECDRKRNIGQHDEKQPVVLPMGKGLELVARHKDGSEFPVEIRLSFLGANEEGGQTVAYLSDITVRKQAEQEREAFIAKLEAGLAERTVLMKEVHHRVKNNLAVIIGLLGMQSHLVGDERLTAALEKSQQRVASMALIHEFLYATNDMDKVNFGEYVQQLTNELCASYSIDANAAAVAVDAEQIELPVHRAIPCGLILNELLSNALKYAFPNGRRGKICVRFVRLETGELSLSCLDDGVGIPENFDWRNSKSMGLKIIQILTKQLHGELTLDRIDNGTRFELKFADRGTHG